MISPAPCLFDELIVVCGCSSTHPSLHSSFCTSQDKAEGHLLTQRSKDKFLAALHVALATRERRLESPAAIVQDAGSCFAGR
jgi:hypothetical protein